MIDINSFIQDNISPKAKCFDDAMEYKLHHRAEGYFHAIDDEIKSAEAIFGKVQQVADLIAKQAERKAKLGRIHEVQPLKADTSATANPKVMAEMAPKGLPNNRNYCWSNAALQLLANAPGIPKGKFEPFIRSYYDAQMLNKTLSSSDNAAAAQALLPGSGQKQTDAADGLRSLLSTTRFGHHIYEELTTPKGEKRGVEQFDPEPIMALDIPRNYATMQELVDRRFAPENVENKLTKTTKIEVAPSDLLIQVNRVDGSIEQTEKFTLSSKSTRFSDHDTTYELKNCIVHSGEDNKGHYIAVLKKPDGWYLANDSVVTKLKDHEAREYLKRGYIFHYAKTKESRSCCSAGVISAISKTAYQIFSYPVNAVSRFVKTNL